MSVILAAGLAGYTIPEIAITIVIIAAIVALVWIALKQFEISIPQWVIQVFWVIVVAFVVVLGIKLLASM